jgi:PIN domain nuclease of toxin-antitoxin system
MRYLLDTEVFVWSLKEPEKLNQAALTILKDSSQEIFLSAVISWEIVIKFALGKLALPKEPAQIIAEILANFATQPLPITHVHSIAVGELPLYHRDPFDRMLIAQARKEGMALMTADSELRQYPVEILWCGK